MQIAEIIREHEENYNNQSLEETNVFSNEDTAFKWAHEAILLLINEYEKQNACLNSKSVSQKKIWERISLQLSNYGYVVTGPQCQSKFAGLKKTYKNIKDHNSKSGNSAKHWSYFTLMDNLLVEKPYISPVATCSSTGKNTRKLSESSSSGSSDVEKVDCVKKRKKASINNIMEKLEAFAKKNEDDRERHFNQYMAFKKESMDHKKKALELLEKLVNKN